MKDYKTTTSDKLLSAVKTDIGVLLNEKVEPIAYIEPDPEQHIDLVVEARPRGGNGWEPVAVVHLKSADFVADYGAHCLLRTSLRGHPTVISFSDEVFNGNDNPHSSE